MGVTDVLNKQQEERSIKLSLDCNQAGKTRRRVRVGEIKQYRRPRGTHSCQELWRGPKALTYTAGPIGSLVMRCDGATRLYRLVDMDGKHRQKQACAWPALGVAVWEVRGLLSWLNVETQAANMHRVL